MSPRKVRSYLGGPLVDPNRPCFSWWDYIMARPERCLVPTFRGQERHQDLLAAPPSQGFRIEDFAPKLQHWPAFVDALNPT